MVKTLTKHGNSLALVIDKAILELLKVDADTPLEISTDGNALIISPVRDKKRREKFTKALDSVNKHQNIEDILVLLRTGNLHLPISLTSATFVPLVASAAVGWRTKPPLIRSMALVTFAYLGVTFLFGVLLESHRNWQLVIMLLPAAMWSLTGGAWPSALRSEADETVPEEPQEQMAAEA